MDKTTTAIAAKVLGIAQYTVRYYMEKNLFDPPIVQCLPAVQQNTKRKKYRYHIYKELVAKRIGARVEDIDWTTGERIA